jgi:hypothetical protein
MYFIIYELSEPRLVYVYSSGLTVVYFALNDGRIRTGLHLESGDSIIMNVVRLEVTLITETYLN